jgi:O-antigen/teichoic acid export membrane protein
LGIIIRQSLKASFVTYIGIALGIVNQLFIATHFLSVTEIGISRSLLTFSTILASVFSFGIVAITDKYFALFADDSKKHNGFLSFLFLYTTVSFIVFCLSYWAFHSLFAAIYSQKSPELIKFSISIVPFTGLIILQSVLETYCRNVQRITVLALLREVMLRLANIIIIILYGLQYLSFDWFIYLTIASYLLMIAGLIAYLKVIGKLYLSKINRNLLNKKVFYQMGSFGFVIILSSIGSNLSNFLDQAMIGALIGQAETGIFSVSLLIASLIEIPRKSINQISAPFLIKAIHRENWLEVQQINQLVSKHQFLAGGLLILYVWCNLDDIFGIMPKGAIFSQGKYVVMLLTLARVLDMLGGMTSEIMGYSKYYHISTVFVVLLGLMTYFTNLILIPILGITGAALATVITIVCFSLAKAIFVTNFLPIKVFNPQIFFVIILCAFTYWVTMMVPTFGTEKIVWRILNIVLRSVVITVLYIGISWRLKFSLEMNQIIDNIFLWISKYFKGS